MAISAIDSKNTSKFSFPEKLISGKILSFANVEPARRSQRVLRIFYVPACWPPLDRERRRLYQFSALPISAPHRT